MLAGYWLCTRCLGSHPRSGCEAEIKCSICNLTNHVAAMHINNSSKSTTPSKQNKDTKQEERNDKSSDTQKTEMKNEKSSKCTKVCRSSKGKDCSKTLLVEITKDGDSKAMFGYAIIDEHCDNTLIDESVLKFFYENPSELKEQDYTMTCASQQISFETKGKILRGLNVR